MPHKYLFFGTSDDSVTATLHCLSHPWLVLASSARSVISHRVPCPLLTLHHPLPFCPSFGWLLNCLPLIRLEVALPLLMPPPPICRQLCLSLCRCLSSCPLSMPLPLMPLVRLVVMSPLLTPPPPVCGHLRLSLQRRLSLRHGLPCLLSGWLLRCLSSHRCLPSADNSTTHCAVASCYASLHAIGSCSSSPAGCCI
jgi:hypothetical protein